MQSSTEPQAGPRSTSRRATRLPSGLPVIGRALEFARDPDAFLMRCRDTYGSAFTVDLLGGPRTFLLDPFDFRTYFQCDAMSFSDVAHEIAGRVFGYDYKAACRDWAMAELEEHYGLLHGDELDALTHRMRDKLLARLEAAVGSAWSHDSLFRFMNEHIFGAGLEALFGDGDWPADVFPHYTLLDRYFGLIALGVPVRAIPGAAKAQAALAAAAVLRPGHARFLAEREAHFERHRVPLRDRRGLQASMLWGSQANTVAAAFWTVLLVLRDPHARRAILEEVRSHGGSPLTRASLGAMVRLESAISEMLRLNSLSMVMRRVERPAELPLDSGATLEIRPGELICLYPRLIHVDPEIYDDPYVFRFDRFLGENGPRQFFKRGRRVTFNLLAFGGGANMCPGRSFARNEIKLIVAALLSSFDVELCSSAMPDLTYSRVGLGVPPPQHDVPFRLRRRAG